MAAVLRPQFIIGCAGCRAEQHLPSDCQPRAMPSAVVNNSILSLASIVALRTSHPHVAAASPAAVEADAHQCCMLPLQAPCAGNEHPGSQLGSCPTLVAQWLSRAGQAVAHLQTLQSIAWAPRPKVLSFAH